jgi:hypothetical protein
MKATELRIGNCVAINPHPVGFVPFIVREIFSKTISISTMDKYMVATLPLEEVYPIPITEEWLVRFGFEALTKKSEGYKADTYAYTRGKSWVVNFDGKRLWTNFWQGREFEYVHQLQNLYFALTGEELTYKP